MRRTALFVYSAAAIVTVAPHVHAQQRASAAPAASASLAPPTMPAGRYEFTSTDDDGDVTSGAVSWTGQQMRIDLDRSRSKARRGNGASVEVASNRRGEYMLVDFSSNMMRTVKPEEHEISEMPLATFEQIIGKALGMVGSVVQMQVRDAGIIAKEVGAGGQVAGVQTEQFRVIEEYNVRIGVFGMNAEEKHHRVVTDYWVPTQAATRHTATTLCADAGGDTAQSDVRAAAAECVGRGAAGCGAPGEHREGPRRTVPGGTGKGSRGGERRQRVAQAFDDRSDVAVVGRAECGAVRAAERLPSEEERHEYLALILPGSSVHVELRGFTQRRREFCPL